MTVAISSNMSIQIITVKSVLTAGLANLVAEAFTAAHDSDNPLHDLLRRHHGPRSYRWYSIDQSSTVFTVMFSSAEKPSILTYRGQPAQIALEDAEPLVVRLQDVDCIRPGKSLVRRAYPHLIKDSP